jgi:hypothetical protein
MLSAFLLPVQKRATPVKKSRQRWCRGTPAVAFGSRYERLERISDVSSIIGQWYNLPFDVGIHPGPARREPSLRGKPWINKPPEGSMSDIEARKQKNLPLNNLVLKKVSHQRKALWPIWALTH